MKGTKEGEEITYDDVYFCFIFLQVFFGFGLFLVKTLKPNYSVLHLQYVLQYYTTVYSAVGAFVHNLQWYAYCTGARRKIIYRPDTVHSTDGPDTGPDRQW
jgi:hypothetical protein